MKSYTITVNGNVYDVKYRYVSISYFCGFSRSLFEETVNLSRKKRLTAFYSPPVRPLHTAAPSGRCPASGRGSPGQCAPGGPPRGSRISGAGPGRGRCPAAPWTAVSSTRPVRPHGRAP